MAKKWMIVLSLLALSCLGAERNAIPPGSKIYVDSNNGFDIFILAAFQAKQVNAQLVSSADKATTYSIVRCSTPTRRSQRRKRPARIASQKQRSN